MKTLNLMWGLPGSGKSMLVESLSNYNYNMAIILLDNIKTKDTLKDTINEWNKEGLEEFIIDGLITNNSIAKEIIDIWRFCMGKSKTDIVIYYFKENRQQCIKNDIKRGRLLKAHITINNNKYEKPDPSILPKFKLIEKEVYCDK